MDHKKPTIRALICLGIAMVFPAGSAFAYDCNTDCGNAAEFTYPCPTFSNPGRKCTGRDPGIYATCETAKAVSCSLWAEVENALGGRIRAALEPTFNAASYKTAEEEGKEREYLALCESAGVSICAAIGAEYGGPYGAALSGAAGVFISYRLCEQSRHW